MALGRIRATNYLPQVIRVLDAYNLRPETRLDGERIAFGAIISLEKFQDPSGYLSVFLASTGWYSQRIRTQASKSLPFIAKDPSPFMLNLLNNPKYDYPTKYIALQTIEKTNVNPKKKSELAVAALGEGHKAVTSDVKLKGTLADMRKLALEMIRKYRSDDPIVYALMKKSYTDRDADTQEKMAAINAIASQKTDEAADLLSEFLTAFNDTAVNKTPSLNPEQTQLIRVIIPALGTTGRPRARTALSTVAMYEYTPVIKNMATEALKQIN